MKRILAVSVLFLILGWTSALFAQDTIPEDIRKDADLVIEVFTGMSKVIDANVGDCAKMGVALEQWANTNADKIAKMQDSLNRLAALSEEQNALMEKEYGPKMANVEASMMKLVDCATDPKVTTTLEKLMPKMGVVPEEIPGETLD